MTAVLPDRVLYELGRTEGGAEALGHLVRDQHTRRLLLLRALLDAAAAAPAAVCPPRLRDRLGRDWSLLEAAERVDRAAVRTVLLYPFVGPWAQRCLRGLTGQTRTSGLDVDLAHLGALAAAAAFRSRLTCRTRLMSCGEPLRLPTLGALRVPAGPVCLRMAGGEMVLSPTGARPLTLRMGPGGACSDDRRWVPLLGLPGTPTGAGPVPLDDLDPYRTADNGHRECGRGSGTGIGAGGRQAWATAWEGVESFLRIGGGHRVAEAAALLRCVVPLASPPGAGPSAGNGAHVSGTRREAFGAVLSSTPAGPAHFASTLVHELQHTKLSALGTIVPLHHEDGEHRYFAPWRSDPRPFDGLLQGAYSHIALADYWQRYAHHASGTEQRDLAWTEHARCREQVGAVLPVLAGSGALSPAGRVLVNEMITLYHRLADCPPPTGHLARAQAYVSTARVIWQQRHGSRRR